MVPMTLHEFQIAATKTALYPSFEEALSPTHSGPGGWPYLGLGLTGEAGEVANKLKKVLRDRNGVPSAQDIREIGEELGDVLWYVATLATEFGLSLDRIAKQNQEKLSERYRERGAK